MLATTHVVISTGTDWAPLISSLIVAVIALAGAVTAYLKANTASVKTDSTKIALDHNSGRIDTMQNGTITDIQRRLAALEVPNNTPPTVTP